MGEKAGSHAYQSKVVHVFAAASLKPIQDEATRKFEDQYPGASLKWSFAGSSDLARQIERGAPADLFISADQKTMDRALQTPDFSSSRAKIIATNTLMLALPSGNPSNIQELQDLTRSRVAVCAREVPCGGIAYRVLQAENVQLNKASQDPNVETVKTKVALGEVDAGFIYATDVQSLAARGVTGMKISGVEPNFYPAALTQRGITNSNAADFYQWLSTPVARQIFARHGYGTAILTKDR